MITLQVIPISTQRIAYVIASQLHSCYMKKISKTKLAKAKHRAGIGRRVRGELKRIENAIIDAGLMPTDD